MEEKRPIIDTKTLVPIAFVLVVAAFVYWFSNLNSQIQFLNAQNILLTAQIEKLRSDNGDIAERLGRVETKLDYLIDASKLNNPK